MLPSAQGAHDQSLVSMAVGIDGERYRKVYIVGGDCGIYKAKAVEHWLEEHSRLEMDWPPGYFPKANPIKRVFGDVYNKCMRSRTRRRLRTLVGGGKKLLAEIGPRKYELTKSGPRSTTMAIH
jgi:hypothetical protein